MQMHIARLPFTLLCDMDNLLNLSPPVKWGRVTPFLREKVWLLVHKLEFVRNITCFPFNQLEFIGVTAGTRWPILRDFSESNLIKDYLEHVSRLRKRTRERDTRFNNSKNLWPLLNLTGQGAQKCHQVSERAGALKEVLIIKSCAPRNTATASKVAERKEAKTNIWTLLLPYSPGCLSPVGWIQVEFRGPGKVIGGYNGGAPPRQSQKDKSRVDLGWDTQRIISKPLISAPMPCPATLSVLVIISHLPLSSPWEIEPSSSDLSQYQKIGHWFITSEFPLAQLQWSLRSSGPGEFSMPGLRTFEEARLQGAAFGFLRSPYNYFQRNSCHPLKVNWETKHSPNLWNCYSSSTSQSLGNPSRTHFLSLPIYHLSMSLCI